MIVPDIRGRGLSEYDPDPTNYHVWTYAKDLLDLCDSLGIGRAIFVGTSTGGLVTMVLSTLRPTLIKSAILNDVGPSIPAKGLARIAALAALKQIGFKNWHDAAVFVAEQNRLAFPNYTQADWLKFARRVFMKGRDGHLRLAFDPRITETFRSATVTSSTYDLEPCFASLAHGRKLLGRARRLIGYPRRGRGQAHGRHIEGRHARRYRLCRSRAPPWPSRRRGRR